MDIGSASRALAHTSFSDKQLMLTYLDFFDSVITKCDYDANLEETVEQSKAAGLYVAACEEKTSIYDYSEMLTPGAIIAAGLQEYWVDTFLSDKSTFLTTISGDSLNVLLKYMNRKVIEEYVELNPYYRTLNCEPPIDLEEPSQYVDVYDLETDTFYKSSSVESLREDGWLFDDIYSSKEILLVDPNNPASLNPISFYASRPENLFSIKLAINNYAAISIIRNHLAEYGLEYEYLEHYDHPISYYKSRKAKPFTVLYCNENLISSRDIKDFYSTYEVVRNYILEVPYVQNYGKSKELYDRYMNVVILFQTIIHFFNKRIDAYIRNDFSNNDDIRLFFRQYNMESLLNNMSKANINTIIEKIDSLVDIKGTEQIITKIVELFEMSNIELYKYLIVKTPKYNHTTLELEVQPYKGRDENYEVSLVKIPINEKSITQYISDTSNRTSLESIAKNDSYFGNTKFFNESSFGEAARLKEEYINDVKTRLLKDESFSYFYTKYIGVINKVNISEIMQNALCFMNMIKSSKRILDSEVSVNGVHGSILDFLVGIEYVRAVRRGDINAKVVHSEMHPNRCLIGFNLDADIDELSNSYPDLIDVNIESKFARYYNTVKQYTPYTNDEAIDANIAAYFNEHAELFRRLWLAFKDTITHDPVALSIIRDISIDEDTRHQTLTNYIRNIRESDGILLEYNNHQYKCSDYNNIVQALRINFGEYEILTSGTIKVLGDIDIGVKTVYDAYILAYGGIKMAGVKIHNPYDIYSKAYTVKRILPNEFAWNETYATEFKPYAVNTIQANLNGSLDQLISAYYSGIKLYDYCVNKMSSIDTYERYESLMKIFRYNMRTNGTAIFEGLNIGDISYQQYLKENNKDLLQYLDSHMTMVAGDKSEWVDRLTGKVNTELINVSINLSASLLTAILENCGLSEKYISDISAAFIDNISSFSKIIEIISYFISHTVQFASSDVKFTINDNNLSLVKVLDYLPNWYASSIVNEPLLARFIDYVDTLFVPITNQNGVVTGYKRIYGRDSFETELKLRDAIESYFSEDLWDAQTRPEEDGLRNDIIRIYHQVKEHYNDSPVDLTEVFHYINQSTKDDILNDVSLRHVFRLTPLESYGIEDSERVAVQDWVTDKRLDSFKVKVKVVEMILSYRKDDSDDLLGIRHSLTGESLIEDVDNIGVSSKIDFYNAAAESVEDRAAIEDKSMIYTSSEIRESAEITTSVKSVETIPYKNPINFDIRLNYETSMDEKTHLLGIFEKTESIGNLNNSKHTVKLHDFLEEISSTR